MSTTNQQEDKAFLDSGQKPNESTTPTTATPTNEEVPKTPVNEFLEKLRKQNDEDYVKNVVSMSDQSSFVITLNKPHPDGKTETIEIDGEKITIPQYDGTEDKTCDAHPLTPQDLLLIEKLRMKFENEKEADRVKIANNQMALYKYLASRYLKLSAEEFDRAYDWTQLKMSVDACDYKALKPHKK